MTMMKCVPLCTSMLVMLCLAVGCGGGGGAGPAPAADPALDATQLALADRLASAHLDNGAFDWRQDVFPYDTTVSGYQNVTGITALGLIDSYEADPALLPSVAPVLDEVAAYLLAVMTDHLADTVSSVSLPNYIFMKRYRDVVGLDAAQWDTVSLSFTKLMLDRNDTDGDVSGVISDGIWNRVFDARAGIPGIRGWDLAFLYKALDCMGWPQSEIDWVYTELVSLPIPTMETYGEISIAHVVEITGLHGDMVLGLPWRTALDGTFVAETEGMSVAGDHQATAYAALALAAWGEDPSDLRTWLASKVGMDGSLVESDNYEYFEIMGEALQALLAE